MEPLSPTSPLSPAAFSLLDLKKEKQIEFEDIMHDDIIILVLGQTGSGKSTFVKAVSGYDTGIDQYSLNSCTNDIFMVKCAVPTEDGQERHVILVDTPGFDHSLRSNSSVVAQLAEWMMALYKLDRFISGIVHLHPIANQISQTVLNILHMVQELWGDAEPSRLIISTSFWPQVIKDTQTEHEALLAQYCQSPPLRFNMNVQGSAMSIITELLRRCDDKVHPVPKLQHELVDKKLPLHRTALAMQFLTYAERRTMKHCLGLWARLQISVSHLLPSLMIRKDKMLRSSYNWADL